MRGLLLLSTIFSVLYSCKEDSIENTILKIPNDNAAVIVLNEGNFQSANGSIAIYNHSTGEINDKVFQSNNGNRPIGDVPQSMVKIDGRYFIVVNNSNKIEVVNAENFKSIGKIEGLNSPRYILPISSTKAYVSDLYEDKLYIINPKDISISKTIPSGGWTEEMVLIDNKIFVCQVDSNQIYVFDATTDELLQKINTNIQPLHLVVDRDEKLWVSCSGGIEQGFPAIHQINPITYAVEKTFEVKDKTKSIGEVEVNPEGDKIIYLMKDLFELSITENTLPQQAKIISNNRLFYGLGVHPSSGDIYISDAIDYLQKGVVYRSNAEGNELSTFKVGIIPGAFYFENEQ